MNGVAHNRHIKINSDDTECLKFEKLPNYDYEAFPLVLAMSKRSISIIGV
jgi:hypothetical protein